ncbi:carbohydrate ABC transporter permease [Methylocapsa sp. S129]|uniref:carbohydrate ABC transporter permease n=1 Tax=Methylocapsa sp. S129 TaxID=1641869 RepID=UPI00131EA4C5|nr:sugar ABC transporter permease [Methylocapsa sp. S129]
MTATAAPATVSRPARTPGAHIGPDWRNGLFIVPFLIVYLGLLIYPLFWGMWISLQQYDMFDQSAIFAGFANFKRLMGDGIFLGTVRNTFLFVLMTVPAFVIIGLALALALNREGRTGATLRAVFFGASVLSVTIVTIIWKMMYLPGIGLISRALGVVGIAPIPFLTSQNMALPAIAATTVWWIIGLPMMLFLAALQQIPGELYEAAALDSAGRWRTLWSITLPSITRTLVVVVIYEIVAQFQLFGQTLLLTQGGPNNSSRSIVLFIYETGFRDWNLGYAAAASEILFLLMAVAAMVQYIASRRREA